MKPITDLTPRNHSRDPLVVRQDVVDEEVDRVARNNNEDLILNIGSSGNNLPDGEEPVPAYSDYNTSVVASDIHVSTY